MSYLGKDLNENIHANIIKKKSIVLSAEHMYVSVLNTHGVWCTIGICTTVNFRAETDLFLRPDLLYMSLHVKHEDFLLLEVREFTDDEGLRAGVTREFTPTHKGCRPVPVRLGSFQRFLLSVLTPSLLKWAFCWFGSIT